MTPEEWRRFVVFVYSDPKAAAKSLNIIREGDDISIVLAHDAGEDIATRLYECSQCFGHEGKDAFNEIAMYWENKSPGWQQDLHSIVAQQCKPWQRIGENAASSHVW